jgi:hypothetical protein
MKPLAVVPDTVALATYGSTIRPRANSSHNRATNTTRKNSSAPLLPKPLSAPPGRSVRSKMAILGVSVLLLASVFVLANMVQSQVYDESSTSLLAVASMGVSPPSQVHVALAGEVQVKSYSAIRTSDTTAVETRLGMTISWATDAKTATSSVRYGLSKDDLSTVQQAEEPCEQYDFCSYKSPWLHHVTVPGDKLNTDTTYYCTLKADRLAMVFVES